MTSTGAYFVLVLALGARFAVFEDVATPLTEQRS
jgi:hypothetical protein